jgi:hypothetical protein
LESVPVRMIGNELSKSVTGWPFRLIDGDMHLIGRIVLVKQPTKHVWQRRIKPP